MSHLMVLVVSNLRHIPNSPAANILGLVIVMESGLPSPTQTLSGAEDVPWTGSLSLQKPPFAPYPVSSSWILDDVC